MTDIELQATGSAGEIVPLGKMLVNNPPRNKYRVAAICYWTFTLGYSDAIVGALLPFIERHYGISYSVVSLIWTGNALGFLFVVMFAHKLHEFLGRQYTFVFGCVMLTIHYSLVSSGSHFALVVLGYFFGGIGVGICNAQANNFIANMEDLTKYLAIDHGGYGLGGTIAPLLSTLLVTRANVPWNLVFLINLGLIGLSLVFLWYSFQGHKQDLKPWDDELKALSEGQANSKQKIREASHNKVTWLLSFFILFYQGSEVSIAGWCTTFLIDYRHGDINSIGYVALAFWACLTLGRLLLTHYPAKRWGMRRLLLVMCCMTIVVAVLAWTIPNVIASGAFVAMSGIWLAPLYLWVFATSVKPGMLPRKIQIVSSTIITAFGSIGGALFPFFVGLIGQHSGSYVVFPVFVSLYGLMMVMWYLLPDKQK